MPAIIASGLREVSNSCLVNTMDKYSGNFILAASICNIFSYKQIITAKGALEILHQPSFIISNLAHHGYPRKYPETPGFPGLTWLHVTSSDLYGPGHFLPCRNYD
jgi:hypothetical protein